MIINWDVLILGNSKDSLDAEIRILTRLILEQLSGLAIPDLHVEILPKPATEPGRAGDRQAHCRVVVNVAVSRELRGTCNDRKLNI